MKKIKLNIQKTCLNKTKQKVKNKLKFQRKNLLNKKDYMKHYKEKLNKKKFKDFKQKELLF